MLMRLMLLCIACTAAWCRADGIPLTYRLPFTGQEKTYRVTLVMALKDEPDWIIRHVLAGAPRTVTAANQGVFTDAWDGNDENGKPVDGDFLVKGIYMPAERWKMDGEWHSLIAEYICSPGDSWTPPKGKGEAFPPIHGHLMEPIYSVSVADTGVACFHAGYIENWFNPFLVDLKKPIGPGQVVAAFPGNAGGTACAYDGKNVWTTRQRALRSMTHPGFGTAVNRRGRRETELGAGSPGGLGDLNVMVDGSRRFLYLADPGARAIHIVDGASGAVLNQISKLDAAATCPDRIAPGTKLYILHKTAEGVWRVVWVPVKDGIPTAKATVQFDVPKDLGGPGDLTMDKAGRFYLAAGRQVFQFSPEGKRLRTFGKQGRQNGKYDPEIFLQAYSIEVWRDPDGKDRLLVCEVSGMQRVSEWGCADGKLIRQWFLCQNAHAGYCMDPTIPEHVYTKALLGGALHRYRVNYATGEWKLDAVWEGIGVSHANGVTPHAGLFPRIVTSSRGKYLFFGGGGYRCYGGYSIYKIDGDAVRASTAIVPGKDGKWYWWRDANGDGKIEESEYISTPQSGPSGSYWADTMLADMSILHVQSKGINVGRLALSGFDEQANPIYGNDWKMDLIVDPTPDAARWGKLPKPDPLHGGNEVSRALFGYTDIEGSITSGLYLAGVYYTDQKLGIDTAAKMCDVWKLSCWIPDGKGGMKQKWRVGRTSDGITQPGEVYSTMHISAPVYGLLGMEDPNGLYHVFTDKGMYVDTMMYHTFKYPPVVRGGMYAHSGESWYGRNYLNRRNGKVYIFMGRANNTIYEVPNWRPGFIKPLEVKTKDGWEARE